MRFALYNRLVIEQALLPLYYSALVFAPEQSIVRRRFEKCIPNCIQAKSKVQADSSAALQTLEGHSSSVYSVASPDGKRAVSGPGDKTVQLWDAVTGAALQALKGHSSRVNSVVFSADSKLESALFVANDWIIEWRTRILWLPPDYRRTDEAAWHKVVVLGHSSEKISILGFKEGPRLIEE